MRYSELATNDAVLAEIGRRLEQQRLALNLTQEELAAQAGLGRATLQRMERGELSQTVNLVKLLRALDLLDALDEVIPDQVRSPIAELEAERRGHQRRRATGRRETTPETESAPWRWGDDGR